MRQTCVQGTGCDTRARQSLTNMALLSFFISPDFGARNDPEMLAKLRAELSKRPEIQEVLARLTPKSENSSIRTPVIILTKSSTSTVIGTPTCLAGLWPPFSC